MKAHDIAEEPPLAHIGGWGDESFAAQSEGDRYDLVQGMQGQEQGCEPVQRAGPGHGWCQGLVGDLGEAQALAHLQVEVYFSLFVFLSLCLSLSLSLSERETECARARERDSVCACVY